MTFLRNSHYFKKFDPDAEYVAIKVFETGGKQYLPGSPFDKTSMPMHKVQAMFNSRKITFAVALNNPAAISALSAEITPQVNKGAFGWLTVTVNGEPIGHKTRDPKEVEKIIEEWKRSNGLR